METNMKMKEKRGRKKRKMKNMRRIKDGAKDTVINA
jgi:hypothetical protein